MGRIIDREVKIVRPIERVWVTETNLFGQWLYRVRIYDGYFNDVYDTLFTNERLDSKDKEDMAELYREALSGYVRGY